MPMLMEPTLSRGRGRAHAGKLFGTLLRPIRAHSRLLDRRSQSFTNRVARHYLKNWQISVAAAGFFGAKPASHASSTLDGRQNGRYSPSPPPARPSISVRERLQFGGPAATGRAVAWARLARRSVRNQARAQLPLPSEPMELHDSLQMPVGAVRRVFGLVGQNETVGGP